MSTIASLGVKEEIEKNKLFHFTKQIYLRDGFGTLSHPLPRKGEIIFTFKGTVRVRVATRSNGVILPTPRGEMWMILPI